MAHTPQIADTLTRLGLRVERDTELRQHTTLRIGGRAEVLVTVTQAEEMAAALAACSRAGVPVRCLGGGSNVLVSDAGVAGVVILNRIAHVRRDGRALHVGAGVQWDDVVSMSVDLGMAGIAAMSGIPGSVGGAVRGNAGAYGECVGDRLASAALADSSGALRVAEATDLGFVYRGSRLKTTGEVVVEATFALQAGDPGRLREQREEILMTRARKHPAPTTATAGSFFKNIDDPSVRRRLVRELGLPDDERRIAAGLLLDRIGARRMRVGDAGVCEKHANIIVNSGNARAADVVALAGMMREGVRRAFGVELEPEVVWMGGPHGRAPMWDGAE